MNVVDALVITLGLDSSQFRKDQVAVADSSKKLKEKLVKDGKDVEKSGKDAAESWGSLKKEIMGVAAAFLGLDAIKNAVGDVTKFNKEVSQSAQSIGVSTQELSAWGMAVERMGGDANSARASLQHLADIFNELKSGKASPETFFWFSKLMAEGGVKLNAAKPMLEQLPQIAEGLKHIAQTQGAARALFVGKQLGLDDGTIRLLMQGKDAVRGIVEDMRKLAPTAEQIDKTNQLYRAWVELKQIFESLANVLTANFAPAFQAIIEKVTEWFGILKDNQKTPKLTFGEVRNQFNQMIDAIREGTAPAIKFFQDVFGPPIKWVIEQIKKLKQEINDVYRAMFGHDLFSESFSDVFDKYRHGGGASGEGGGSGARGASRAGVGARVRHGHRGGGEGSNGPVAPRDPHATSIAMKAAMDQLRKEGVPEPNLKVAAAHLVGQAEMESGLRPGLVHDNGTGYGIYGARLGRRDRMLSWLAANGYAKDSLKCATWRMKRCLDGIRTRATF
jgi:hypothetical protein